MSLTQAQLVTAIEASAPVVTGLMARVATAYSATSSANSAALITLPAVTGKRWIIYSLEFSYAQLPSSGVVTIAEAGVEKYRLFVTTAGAAPTRCLRKFAIGAAITVTLVAGGAGVIGSLNLSAEAA